MLSLLIFLALLEQTRAFYKEGTLAVTGLVYPVQFFAFLRILSISDTHTHATTGVFSSVSWLARQMLVKTRHRHEPSHWLP